MRDSLVTLEQEEKTKQKRNKKKKKREKDRLQCLSYWVGFGYELIVHEEFDPIQHFGNVDTARVPDTSAVIVGNVGIDRQDGIRATQ